MNFENHESELFKLQSAAYSARTDLAVAGLKLAEAYRKTGNTEEASRVLRDVLRLIGHRGAETYLGIVYSMVELELYDEAISAIENGPDAYPDLESLLSLHKHIEAVKDAFAANSRDHKGLQKFLLARLRNYSNNLYIRRRPDSDSTNNVPA